MGLQPSLSCTWVNRICLCSLQWNFLQAGAAQALGQALQDNRSLASLQ